MEGTKKNQLDTVISAGSTLGSLWILKRLFEQLKYVKISLIQLGGALMVLAAIISEAKADTRPLQEEERGAERRPLNSAPPARPSDGSEQPSLPGGSLGGYVASGPLANYLQQLEDSRGVFANCSSFLARQRVIWYTMFGGMGTGLLLDAVIQHGVGSGATYAIIAGLAVGGIGGCLLKQFLVTDEKCSNSCLLKIGGGLLSLAPWGIFAALEATNTFGDAPAAPAPMIGF